MKAPNPESLLFKAEFWARSHRVFLWAMGGLFAAGAALRFAWLFSSDRLSPTSSEMFYVARTFAETGQLADAYGPGSGPTAHVTPVMPVLAGTVYRLFGVGAPPAELTLAVLAFGFVALSLIALNKALEILGSPPIARFAALAVMLLVPVNISLEMGAFRVWEGAVGAAVVALFLWCALELDRRPARPGWLSLAGLAAAGGVIALISPPVALACYGIVGLLALRRRGVIALGLVAALSAVSLVAISYPWAVRNEAVFGQKVWSRTNFGFNFALGFHQDAVDPADPKAAFLARLEEVDPYTSPQALENLKAVGGEQAYSTLWTERTVDWIKQDPAGAMKIALRHLVEFYFPPAWMWSIYSERGGGTAIKQAIIWIVTFLGVVGVCAGLLRRDWRYLYLLAAISLPALPYILAQPIIRYKYPIFTILIFAAADFVWTYARRLWIVIDRRPSTA
jgi:4-amino-4-deoxy-L-arabinose transferase-like glycosyltransferase